LSKAPAFQLYAADFYMDTVGWSCEEVGLYFRLLMAEWVNGPLPNDPVRLAKICQISLRRFEYNFKNVSSKFIPNVEGYLENTRLELTREKQHKYSESRARVANTRWHKDDAYALHKDMHTGCPSSSSSNNINTLVHQGSLIDESGDAPLPPKIEKKPPKPDTCPHQKIIDLYHTELPMLNRVRDWTANRSTMLKARWQSKAEYQDLDWWRQYFIYIREKCTFLIGAVPTRDGKEPWRADLPWIIQQKNFTKILEGGYER
jgi:uncharacterized protein YdaU (DUF1376 family)